MNLGVIVCSFSCPKNVLDNSAEDILRGAIFCDQIIPECTDSVSKTFPLSQLSIKINNCKVGYEVQRAWDCSGLMF